MTEIPDRQFDKIAIDLVTECETSNSGNKNILTIIDHLMDWPEAFPKPDKLADTIVLTFINQYLPVHICPRYILSDHGTEFKNNLMDQVLKQLSIERIFSAPYHPQSNGKLETFHKYLKPTLKKLCEKDPSNWDKYINQVLASYRVTPNLATAETPFLLVDGRDPNHFTTARKTMDRTPPSFKISDRVYFKNQGAQQMGPQMETWIQNCPN